MCLKNITNFTIDGVEILSSLRQYPSLANSMLHPNQGMDHDPFTKPVF